MGDPRPQPLSRAAGEGSQARPLPGASGRNVPAERGPPRDGAVGPPLLVAVFLLGCLLFSYPLLALFNVHASVLGVPLLYAYLLCDWAALIVLIRWAVSRSG